MDRLIAVLVFDSMLGCLGFDGTLGFDSELGIDWRRGENGYGGAE